MGAALTSLGLRPEEEVSLAEGYSLDFAVDWRGERIGVEVDGPPDLVGREPTVKTLLKRRQLRNTGWRLVPVPYCEWDQAAGSGLGGEYLSSLLSALGPASGRPHDLSSARRLRGRSPARWMGGRSSTRLHSKWLRR